MCMDRGAHGEDEQCQLHFGICMPRLHSFLLFRMDEPTAPTRTTILLLQGNAGPAPVPEWTLLEDRLNSETYDTVRGWCMHAHQQVFRRM